MTPNHTQKQQQLRNQPTKTRLTFSFRYLVYKCWSTFQYMFNLAHIWYERLKSALSVAGNRILCHPWNFMCVVEMSIEVKLVRKYMLFNKSTIVRKILIFNISEWYHMKIWKITHWKSCWSSIWHYVFIWHIATQNAATDVTSDFSNEKCIFYIFCEINQIQGKLKTVHLQ